MREVWGRRVARVFPAYAGVSRPAMSPEQPSWRLPRLRGGEPSAEVLGHVRLEIAVFPAYAGVSRPQCRRG